MAATARNITRKQGDTWPIVATINDGADPLDLTGATAIAIGVAATHDADQPDVTVENGALDSDGSDGKVKFDSLTNVSALPPGNYYAEITFTLGGFIYSTDTFRYEVQPQLVR